MTDRRRPSHSAAHVITSHKLNWGIAESGYITVTAADHHRAVAVSARHGARRYATTRDKATKRGKILGARWANPPSRWLVLAPWLSENLQEMTLVWRANFSQLRLYIHMLPPFPSLLLPILRVPVFNYGSRSATAAPPPTGSTRRPTIPASLSP